MRADPGGRREGLTIASASGTHRLFTDGGARGNPGPAGIGAVLLSPEGEVLAELARGIGWTTNNVAEYTALIEGLQLALERGVQQLAVSMDSLLVVQQMKGAWRVKEPHLKPLHARARELAGQFRSIRFQAIPRERNTHADGLSNRGMDEWEAQNPGFKPPAREADTLF